jgi:NAD(P)-dependent dehydrogenase (short-subunit alcohol dehydrogenase family)
LERIMEFRDKVVLVTGSSRGIGRAIAWSFARQGAAVAVHYHRNREAAERTHEMLAGGPHGMFSRDLSRPEEAKSLIEDVMKQFGRIDILVNNAGIYSLHPVLSAGYEEWFDQWQRTLSVNLLSPAHLMYWAAKYMARHGGGRIVNVSSRGAFRGEPDAPAYGASKAGLNALSQSLAQALAPHNVFITTVAPGFVETDMAAEFLTGPEGEKIKKQSPLGRVARPEEIARTVLFLASEESSYLTGAIVDINGASYLR